MATVMNKRKALGIKGKVKLIQQVEKKKKESWRMSGI
jgi:hypothetical protein